MPSWTQGSGDDPRGEPGADDRVTGPAGEPGPAAGSTPSPASRPDESAGATHVPGARAQTSEPAESGPAGPPPGRIARLRAFLRRHHRKFWWIHSAYALGLGVAVMMIAGKGLAYARWLVVSLAVTWLVFLVFFRVVGSGARRRVDTPGAKVRMFAMTYVLKNMYQGMLFFLLPFYWKSSTWGAVNMWFVVVLGASAFVATMDVIFDQFIMRWRAVASLFYLIALFACLNLLVPIAVPWIPVLWALLAASAASTIVFLTLHVRFRTLFSKGGLIAAAAVCIAVMAGAYAGRRAVPPVPYQLKEAAIMVVDSREGGSVRREGEPRLSEISGIVALTAVAVLRGEGEDFRHVWRRAGREIASLPPAVVATEGSAGVARLRSELSARQTAQARPGEWTVDVETAGGQLVGRTTFMLRE